MHWSQSAHYKANALLQLGEEQKAIDILPGFA